MKIVFPSDATRSATADWLEMELLLGDRRSVTDTSVARADTVLEDEPSSKDEVDDDGNKIDRDIADTATEERKQAIWDELTHRQKVLGELYPFELQPVPGGSWRLIRREGGSAEVRAARWVYRHALIISCIKQRLLRKQPSDEAGYASLIEPIAQTFQAVSVFAAQNILGSVYWFGWPRFDDTGFHEAVKKVTKLVGPGEVRPEPPEHESHVKDATVDIVGWRSFGDHNYGALFLYGQVASGSNWDTKPIRAHIASRYFDQYVDEPSHQFLGATFMPFPKHARMSPKKGTSWDKALISLSRQQDKDHGCLVDRFRLTELIGQGLGDESKRHGCPEPCETIREVISWVHQARRYCDQVST